MEMELSSGKKETKDGFRIEISGGLANYKTPGGVPYKMIWWNVLVPDKIKGVRLNNIEFLTLDKDGLPICSVSMGKGSVPDARGMRLIYIYAEPNHAKSCKLVFRYWNGSITNGDIMTEYTVPLKDHVLAALQKSDAHP